MATNTEVCRVCNRNDREEILLICDGCETLFHTECLNLPGVPAGDWYCPSCRFSGRAPTPESPFKPGMKVVLYERVSSKGQDKPEVGNIGLRTQNHALLEFVARQGLVITTTKIEVKTGRKPDQLEELTKAIRQTRRGQPLLIYSVSRFGRNLSACLKLLEWVHQRGSFVYSVSDDLSSLETGGRFTSLLHQAEEESNRLARVVRESYRRRKEMGCAIGRPPYGKKAIRDASGLRRFVTEPEEVRIMKKIDKMVIQGTKLKDVATILNNSGLLRRGKPWTASQVSSDLNKTAMSRSFARDLIKALP